jgi:hypothetical protein
MTKAKKVFTIIMMVLIQVLLTGGIYVVGVSLCEILYECTDWWCISDYEFCGALLVLIQTMYWLSRAYKALLKKVKEV